MGNGQLVGMHGRQLSGTVSPSFYYTHTEEEIERITKNRKLPKMIESKNDANEIRYLALNICNSFHGTSPGTNSTFWLLWEPIMKSFPKITEL